MFTKISEQVTQSLINNHTIKSEEREIYRYGIQQGLMIILNIVTTLGIGIILKMLWQSIVFTVAYYPLRRYAGGYHAKTPFQCYLLSILLIIITLEVMKMSIHVYLIYYLMLILSSSVIAILSPIEDINKPLDRTEQKVYKTRTCLVVLIEVAFSILCIIFSWINILKCIVFSFTDMSIMLILGKVKNKFQKTQISL